MGLMVLFSFRLMVYVKNGSHSGMSWTMRMGVLGAQRVRSGKSLSTPWARTNTRLRGSGISWDRRAHWVD